MIIAVDFDGTLSFGEWPKIGTPNEKLFQYLIQKQKSGDKIILWTCREMEDLDAAVLWCEKQGLIFDAVNDNLPEVIARWGGNSRKVDCDLYIDDKSVWADLYEKYPLDVTKHE